MREHQGYRIRALKREELIAMGSVVLHELYFGNLGGDVKIPEPARAMLEEHFGSFAAWRREFVGTAQSTAGGTGWSGAGTGRPAAALHLESHGHDGRSDLA